MLLYRRAYRFAVLSVSLLLMSLVAKSDARDVAALRVEKSGDFNGDKRVDLLLRDLSLPGANYEIWLMDGANITTKYPLPHTNGHTVAGVGDFDGDGRADILWGGPNGSLSLWLMNGTSAHAPDTSLPTMEPGWRVAGVGDFNGDGKADILLRNQAGQNLVWLMDGTKRLEVIPIESVDSDWTVSAIRDFDGDGCADIVWQHMPNLGLEIWTTKKDHSVHRTSFDVAKENEGRWHILGAGDFDGDGKPDLLWSQLPQSSDLAMWMMDGLTVKSKPSLDAKFIASKSDGWGVMQIADFNGDKRDDILLWNQKGEVAIWLMNGTEISEPVVTGIGDAFDKRLVLPEAADNNVLASPAKSSAPAPPTNASGLPLLTVPVPVTGGISGRIADYEVFITNTSWGNVAVKVRNKNTNEVHQYTIPKGAKQSVGYSTKDSSNPYEIVEQHFVK